MTTRGRRFVAFFLLLAFLPALGTWASAQPAPTPPPGQAPPQPQPPPAAGEPQAAPAEEPGVVPNERPMRFVLTGGNVVIGTKIGEDAEFYTVQTSTGPVRIRKTDIAFMDFNTQAGAPAPAPAVAPTAPAPTYQPVAPPPVAPYPARPKRPGRGLFIAGVIVFSIFYGLTALIGTIASTENPSALALLVPVLGPIIFYAIEPARESFGILLVDSLAQAAGLIMWIAGRSVMSAAEEEEASNPFRIADGVDLVPAISTRAQGLVLSLDL